MKRITTFKTKQLADLAGVTVRTLHYYDDLGLLVPALRSDAGYRLYDRDNLLRLQQILVQRALGLSLDEIKRLLDDPGFEHRRALLKQRDALRARAAQTEAMLASVEQALALLDNPDREDLMSYKPLFTEIDAKALEAEAEQRWGKTDAFAESRRRTQNYDKAQMAAIQAEQMALYAELQQLRGQNFAVTSPEVQVVIEKHRLLIDRWFYPCSKEMHRKLGELYIADERFAATIDQAGAGLTPFLSEAISLS
jgi:DNA-binding transcriptional MerR regulator